MHTADFHILDSESHEVWIDVRVTAVPLNGPVRPALREAERAEFLPSCPTMDVDDGVRRSLFVLKQLGKPLLQMPVLTQQLSLIGQRGCLPIVRQRLGSGKKFGKKRWASLRLKLAIRLRGQTVRSDSFWGVGCDFSAARF